MNKPLVIVKFIKTHPDAILPTKAYEDDNCYDVYAIEDTVIPPSTVTNSITTTTSTCDNDWFEWGNLVPVRNVKIGCANVPIGLQVAYITPGFGFVFRGRSGLGFKYGLMPHMGEVDTKYRGIADVKLYNFTDVPYTVKKGDRCAQIKIEKVWPSKIEEVFEIEETDRGISGFGSTGK